MTDDTGPKVVVVGTGGGGCRIHMPALRAAGFNVVGLVGRELETTAERARVNDVPRAFTRLDDAIKETGAKAVTVSTPPHAHAPMVLTAIAQGCHVLCEKPFAKDTAEARAMLEAATEAGIVHMLGNEFRWDPARATVGAALAKGLIGEPRFLAFTGFNSYISSPDTHLPEWWLDPSAGGGWLGAQGSHVIDCVRIWLADFESISAARQWVTVAPKGAEDSYVIRFRLTNGVEGVIQQSGGAWGPSASMMRVAGTRGTVWIERGIAWLADGDGTRELPVAPEIKLLPLSPLSRDPRHQTAEWKLLASVELPLFQRLCQVWRAKIERSAGSSAVPPPTFADGVANMNVLDAVRASIARGGALVTVPRI
jgi:predicted dehydrogenase